MNEINLGQVFTPKIVADYMVDLFTIEEDSRVLDPCFGKGVFINSLLERTSFKIDGIELDERLFNKYNTRDEFNNNRCKLINDDFLFFEGEKSYNGIIMNPPYIRQEEIDKLTIYGITKNRLHSIEPFNKLSKSSNLYMYFVLKAIEMLKFNGELIVIFPNTWLKSQNAKEFRKYIEEKCTIEKRIFVSGKVFGNDILVDVLIMKIIKGIHNIKTQDSYIRYENNNIVNIDKLKIKSCKLSDKTLVKNHVPLKTYCNIRRGITTGHNKLFVSNFSEDEDFENYTEKIISSPKNIIDYNTDNADTDDLLVIHDEWEALNERVKSYLGNEKNNILKEGRPKTLYTSIKRGNKWYSLNTFNCQGIIFSYIIRDSMKFIMNNREILIRDNFYIIYPNIDKLLLFGLLNNYYTYSRLEKAGKKYGGGILKIQKYDLEEIMIIDIDIIEEKDIKDIIELSLKLINTGNTDIINSISFIMSKYENISLEKIIQNLNMQKYERLGKGASYDK